MNKLKPQIITLLTKTTPYDATTTKRILFGNEEHQNSLKLLDCIMENVVDPTNVNDDKLLRSIVAGMGEYQRRYPVSVVRKQSLYNELIVWMNRISERLGISCDETYIEENIIAPCEPNLSVGIVKALHNRNGVTKEELAEQFSVSQKTIQNELAKLDATKVSKLGAARLGGQQMLVNIQHTEVEKGKRYYRTDQTLHPLVMQLNVTQVGFLLESLCASFYNNEREVCFAMAADLWAQLSEYGKDRVREVFCKNNPDLRDMIADIEDISSESEPHIFQTEKEMMETLDLSDQESLLVYYKTGQKINITILKDGQWIELHDMRVVLEQDEGEQTKYYVIQENQYSSYIQGETIEEKYVLTQNYYRIQS